MNLEQKECHGCVPFSVFVFAVDSKGRRLVAHNAQWSFDINAVVKHCVHLTGLVCSPTNLNISITDMNVSSPLNM
jgi:hypothetical protein